MKKTPLPYPYRIALTLLGVTLAMLAIWTPWAISAQLPYNWHGFEWDPDAPPGQWYAFPLIVTFAASAIACLFGAANIVMNAWEDR